MSAPVQTPPKPAFKAPEQSPFKAADPPWAGVKAAAPSAPPRQSPDAAAAPVPNGWQPIATAPDDPQARFRIRTSVNGKPVNGTEIVVRYRPSRKRVMGKWKPGLTIVDDRLGTKLGFRPTEWSWLEESKAPRA